MTLKIIGERYEVKQKIGSGGMADVYLAFDTVLKRKVAIKILRADLNNDPVALLRFQREAHSGSGLNHANIVEIYDVGSEDDVQYIVMEYVEGATAKEMIMRRGPLDVEEAVDFMTQLLRGISKAHQEDIIHRDIKPQNILVKGDGTLKISDFGIAQAGNALQLTKTDSVLGSIHYLAPEVVRGEGASFSSDIYATGIIFYELLTGKLPYDAKMPVEIAMMHLRDPLPSVQEINPSIPNSIVNVINKATAKNIRSRYYSAQSMLEDLKTALDKERENELLWVPANEDNGTTKMIDRLDDVHKVSDKTVPKNNKKKWFIASGVLVVLIAFIVFMAMNSKPKVYIMENLTGMSVDEAKEILAEYNISISSNIQYLPSDEIEEDLIMQTSPAQGAEVEYGSQIRIVLSEGPLFEVGDYAGEHIDDVRTLLTSNTNLYLRILHEPSQDIKPGIILRQEGVLPGEQIDPKVRKEIVLVVASEVEIRVEYYIGRSVMEVKTELENQGIVVVLNKLSFAGMSNSEIASVKTDTVMKTIPVAGSVYIQTENNEFIIEYYDSADQPVIQEETPPDDQEDEG